jgi:hypothetical protein
MKVSVLGQKIIVTPCTGHVFAPLSRKAEISEG